MKIDAFIFGGRRSTHPRATGYRGAGLDRKASTWPATMGSETTAAAAGQQAHGAPRPVRDAAVCRLQRGRLFPATGLKARRASRGLRREALKIEPSTGSAKTPMAAKFVWPGFGDNMRVMAWMLERVEGRGRAKNTSSALTPRYSDIHWHGLDFSEAQYQSVTSIDHSAWAENKHTKTCSTARHNLPPELPANRRRFRRGWRNNPCRQRGGLTAPTLKYGCCHLIVIGMPGSAHPSHRSAPVAEPCFMPRAYIARELQHRETGAADGQPCGPAADRSRIALTESRRSR